MEVGAEARLDHVWPSSQPKVGRGYSLAFGFVVCFAFLWFASLPVGLPLVRDRMCLGTLHFRLPACFCFGLLEISVSVLDRETNLTFDDRPQWPNG